MCAFESCDKPCYIEYIDVSMTIYCGKQHAEKHRERIEAVWPGSYEFLKRYIYCQYSSSDCDIDSSNIVTGMAMHGHRLHSQTGENIISLQRCMCVYNNGIFCRKILAVSIFSLAQSLALMKII